MKKRIISILLVLCMTLGIFVGCGKKESVNSGEQVTLTVARPQSSRVTDYNTNAFTLYLEEKLNINLDIVTFSANTTEFGQQLTLMATSKEKLPDIILGYNDMTLNAVNNYGENKVFIDLKDHIEKSAPNYKEAFSKLSKEDQNTITQGITDPETGAIYTMPLFTEFVGIDSMQNAMFINQEWLNKVGMSAPTNVDELYQVLKAFKEKDPNGNGKADEIPMLGEDIVYYILNAFVYYEHTNKRNVKDGELYDPTITDEYRQALIYCNKLVKEGLLSELNFTLASRTEYISLISPSDDVAKVGIWCGHPTNLTTTTTTILNQYTALDSLNGATELGGYMALRPKVAKAGAFITKDCENIEAAMKFLDSCYEVETQIAGRWGEQGVEWEYGEGGTNIFGEPTNVLRLVAEPGDNSRWWGAGVGCGIATKESGLADVNINDTAVGQQGRLSTEATSMVTKAKVPKELAVNLTYTKEENSAIGETTYNINSYENEMRAAFILGTNDPNSDAEWNAYLDKVESLGLSKVLKTMQKVYDRQYK